MKSWVIFYTSTIDNVVCGQAASTSPGSFLEMQIHGPHPDVQDQTLGEGPSHLCLMESSTRCFGQRCVNQG